VCVQVCVSTQPWTAVLTTYKSLHIVAHSRSVVVTSWTRGSSVGMTVSLCLPWQWKHFQQWLWALHTVCMKHTAWYQSKVKVVSYPFVRILWNKYCFPLNQRLWSLGGFLIFYVKDRSKGNSLTCCATTTDPSDVTSYHILSTRDFWLTEHKTLLSYIQLLPQSDNKYVSSYIGLGNRTVYILWDGTNLTASRDLAIIFEIFKRHWIQAPIAFHRLTFKPGTL